MAELESTDTRPDVLLVGAGFAGLYLLNRLRGLGYSVTVVDAASELGGVWYWNCYPGARVDSPGALYQFSHEEVWKDWDFTEKYPAWDEVRAYLRHADKKLDLSRDIRFDTLVVSAEFAEDARRWTVRTDDGSVLEPSYLVLCTGISAKPYVPSIPGLDSFGGEWHHTGAWPQGGVDLAGRRVGLFGTGASGVQVVQEAAKEAAALTVFQRTPNMALPMGQKQLTAEDKRAIKQTLPELFTTRLSTFSGFDIDFDLRNTGDVSAEERERAFRSRWDGRGFHFWLGGFQDLLFDETANRQAYAFWRDRVHERVHDPAVAEKLAPAEPPHPFGVKRPSLEQNYFEAYNQDNVTLVDLRQNPVETVTRDGVLTADGTEHEIDLLVLATGFDAITGGLTSIDIRGTAGRSLAQTWADGVETHLGVAVAEFPNLMFVYGPQAPTAFCNGPTCAELQGDLIVGTLEHLRRGGFTRIEATPQAQREWTELIHDIVEPSLFPRAESWYMGANIPGKARQMLNFPGGLPAYKAKWAECRESGYAGFAIS